MHKMLHVFSCASVGSRENEVKSIGHSPYCCSNCGALYDWNNKRKIASNVKHFL